MVTFREYWAEDDVNVVTDVAVSLAKQYNTVVQMLSEPVLLEKCTCGCAGYLIRTITSHDLARMQDDLM